MKLLKAAGVALVALAGAAPALAQERGWVMIGRGEAGTNAEGSFDAREVEPFREIMLCVQGGDVRFDQLGVRLREGGSLDLRLRATVEDGDCSRFISLRGRRDIAGLDFTHDPALLRGATARVELFAR